MKSNDVQVERKLYFVLEVDISIYVHTMML